MRKSDTHRKEPAAAVTGAYLALVRDAIADGQSAAAAAYMEFAKTAERTPEGRIVDVFGGAWVAVHKPSYRLRTALKALGEIEKDGRGSWCVSKFTKGVKEQSVTAHRIACEAASAVLQRRFPEDGEFYTHSFRD
jgi:hypothetical protein